MKIDIDTTISPPLESLLVGNVYPVRGGRGLRYGHMMVLLAITEPRDQYDSARALMLIVDKEGRPKGVTQYGLHYVEELSPIAFVDGLEDVHFTMRSL